MALETDTVHPRSPQEVSEWFARANVSLRSSAYGIYYRFSPDYLGAASFHWVYAGILHALYGDLEDGLIEHKTQDPETHAFTTEIVNVKSSWDLVTFMKKKGLGIWIDPSFA